METLASRPDERVVFGAGAERAVAGLLEELGARRVLLVAQARHGEGAARIAKALGARAVDVFVTEAAQVPGEVADAAVARARAVDADWVLAHGGGTPIGVAKAIALALPVAIAAVPTTYAGSERTDVWGITRDGKKTTGRDARVRPRLVAYDPELTLALDRAISLDSLCNALAHSLEALYAADATPEARRAAEASLVPLVAGLRAIAKDPADLAGRTLALRGAALASESLGGASMGLHHKLAHVLGGTFGTAHARTHATLLPYTFGFNAPAAPDTVALLHRVWGTDDPPAFLYDLQRELGLVTSLRALVADPQIGAIADEVLAVRYPNPRPLERDAIVALLDDAMHDRRPSLRTARIAMPAGAAGTHAGMAVTVHGAALARARVVILALHGRGASADRFAGDLARRIGPRDDLAIVAPQARGNTWYPKGFAAPIEDNQPDLGSALAVVDALYRELAATIDPARIVVVGFSQGACLALTWLSTTAARPARVLAFTGAPTELADAAYGAARGVALHLGAAAGDPWVKREVFEATAARFRAAGARVEVALAPGDAHGIHAADDAALRAAIARAAVADDLTYQSGYGSALASEARPGALPRDQNSPHRVPYGLVAEQLNGTGFTVRRAENRRTWMYRLRPQILDRPFRPRAHDRFVGDFTAAVALPEHLGFTAPTLPAEPTDFVAGITTFAGAGDATIGKGAAIHLYAATADMVRTAFCNVDGDLVVVPERGRLHVQTELGWLQVAPGEIAILPRGIRFRIALPDGAARGFLGELYDGHLALPDRGPIGANGLADERHFLAPTAAFEDLDDGAPWTIVVRQGGRLWEIDAAHSPFDVVAWHGTYAPFKYALDKFTSLGSVSFDHADPSILTVLTAPIDGHGRSALDVGVFRGRWDVAEHTFRPPFFHRNSAVEFNMVVASPAGSRWAPGAFTFTPYLTPHGISARGYANTVTGAVDPPPERLSDESLWLQFESAYMMKIMPWMLDHPARDRGHLATFARVP